MKPAAFWPPKQLSDETVIERVLSGEGELFEIIIRRYNQRLYRTAMAIVHEAEEAAEVLQESYLKAFEHLHQFSGRAQFSTWLTRITINEALARLSKRTKVSDWNVEEVEDSEGLASPEPERRLVAQSLKAILEMAIGKLHPRYRMVFVLREIEKLSTAETANCLEISQQLVKVRLHRARGFLRKEIQIYAGITSETLYEFMGDRCDLTVSTVMEKIRILS